MLDDEDLTKFVAEEQIPLTVCPLSNLKLKIVDHMDDHPLPEMLDKGLMVTINSDDPAYFGGYINENYEAVQKSFDLGSDALVRLAKNSFNASLLSDDEKKKLCMEVDLYCNSFSE